MYPERSVSAMPDQFHLGACIRSSVWLQQSVELTHCRSQQTTSSSLARFSVIFPGEEDPCRLLLPPSPAFFPEMPFTMGLGIHFGVWDSLETCRRAGL